MTLEEPTSGNIYVEGQNLWKMKKGNKLVRANEEHLSKIRGNIGMVFQHFNLFPHMTILQNCMTAPIHVQKKSKEEAEKLSIEMLEKVGLEDKLDNYPNQLSGGQKQRVAMARALVMQPRSEEHTSELQSRGQHVCTSPLTLHDALPIFSAYDHFTKLYDRSDSCSKEIERRGRKTIH